MYKALRTFFGMKVSMTKGQVKEITDKEVIKDLLKAGYIEEVKPIKEEVKPIKEEVKTIKEEKKKKVEKKATEEK